MLYAIIFLIGIIIGIAIRKGIESFSKIYGIIEIDERTQMCKVKITSSELGNLKTKKAMFKIIHGSKISRDDHLL